MTRITLTQAEAQNVYDTLRPIAAKNLADGDCSLAEKTAIEASGIDLFLTSADVAKATSLQVGFEHAGQWFGDLETIQAFYKKAVASDRADGNWDGVIANTNSIQVGESNLLDQVFEEKRMGVLFVRTNARILGQNADGSGSGFIISKTRVNDTYRYQVATNAHVVDSTIETQIDYRDLAQELSWDLKDANDQELSVEVRLVGLDPLTDLALLEFESREDYPVLSFATTDNLESLQKIIVIGNTQGQGITPNIGMIKNPETGNTQYDFRVFHHDARIAPGNSGGPVLNEQGEVIGVNFQAFNDGSIGIAFPASRALDSLQRMHASPDESVTYGYWGAGLAPLSVTDAQAILPDKFGSNGQVVRTVAPHSPAEAAGLLPGDVLIAINGQTDVIAAHEFQKNYLLWELIRTSNANEVFTLTVVRDGKKMDCTLHAGSREYRRLNTFDTGLGFMVSDLNAEYLEAYGLPTSLRGAMLHYPSGTESNHYLNTIITELNGTPITDATQFRATLDRIRSDETIVMKTKLSGFAFNPAYQSQGTHRTEYIVIER